jgi:calcium-dependent protein kinase
VRIKDLDRLKREIAIMRVLDHPNIVKLIETFEDRRSIYLVMELCSGGELLDALAHATQFSEIQAATLMRQIFRAVFYMHENKTCHGDLKPDNLMFSTPGPIDASTLKIIDFGLSCRLGEASQRRAKGSTPYYTAPEAISGNCSKDSDLWSCGAIMYTMLCGRPPFNGESREDVISSIRRGTYSFPRGRISENGQHLIRKLMKLSPSKRYTAERALTHLWLQETALPEDKFEIPSDFIENLRMFQKAGRMKKLALNLIASQLTESQIINLRQIFTSLDKNQDGLLTAAEITDGLKDIDVPSDLHEILASIDSDKSGQIDYTEFVAASLQRKYYEQEDVCWTAFNMFDRDADGKISQSELRHVLQNEAMTDELGICCSLQDMIGEMDLDGDGFINFNQFASLMRGDPLKQGRNKILSMSEEIQV